MKLILSALLLSLWNAPAPAVEDAPIPFADFGKTFLKAHFKTEDATQAPVEKLRADQCVHGQFGFIDLAFPIWRIGDKQHVEDFRALTTAILQMQQRWIDWLAKGDKSADGPKADADALIAWVKTWKPASFAKADSAANKDIFALLGANEALTAATKRLRDFIATPESLGVAPKGSEVLNVIFAPTRRDFVEMLGYSGLVDTTLQTAHWSKDGTMWTSFWIGWNYVLALEYPPWVYDKDFKTGLSMNKFEATGMLEHTVQQMTLTFIWMVYGDNDALYLNQAQAMNMAIEICGQVNALEGDGGRGTTGARTSAYEKFVPGGNSEGGTLPPMPAGPLDGPQTNAWHEGLGKDYFAAPLRKGQKLAPKLLQKEKPPGVDPVVLKDKNAHFVISSADLQKKYVISAPFFGPFAGSKPYPPLAMLADYKEFFRAYKCGFFHWIQTQGDKAGAEASAAKYRELMKKLGTREPGKKFEDIIAELYGVPISGKNGETDSLEWRFLEWLAKGK
jgi:hypothetical protein